MLSTCIFRHTFRHAILRVKTHSHTLATRYSRDFQNAALRGTCSISRRFDHYPRQLSRKILESILSYSIFLLTKYFVDLRLKSIIERGRKYSRSDGRSNSRCTVYQPLHSKKSITCTALHRCMLSTP